MTPVDIFQDVTEMHVKYGTHEKMKELTKEKRLEFLKFRFKCIKEEFDEGYDAIHDKNPEEIVDALIDMIVFAAGTLDLYRVDGGKAWNAVKEANLNKEVGIKAERPNMYGFPDLIKKEGWKAPSHVGNHGLLTDTF